MFRLRISGHILKHFINTGSIYLPDFIIYDMDETEYQNFWRSIKDHPRDQLYTHGVGVYPVNWVYSLFQRFKGWLGFENHCHPNKVEITLAKIAYVGYLHGYKSEELASLKIPVVSNTFMSSVLSDKNDNTTTGLQQQLLTYFNAYSAEIAPYVNSHHSNYRFGDGFLKSNQAHLIPTLDPQDAVMIQDSIHALNGYFLYPEKGKFLQGSKYVEHYADHLASQNQFERALMWSSSVVERFKQAFIQFYFRLGTPISIGAGVELMDRLAASPSSEDQTFILELLKNNLSKDEQLSYLKDKPQLRHKLAVSYLEEAKIEKRKWKVTSFLTGNNLFPLLSHAVSLDPSILDHDSIMNDASMKTEWITYQFNEAIKKEKFEQAKEIFEQNPDFKFNKSNLRVLRGYYRSLLEETEGNIKRCLQRSNTKEASQLAEQALHYAKQIAKISPEDNPLHSTMNTYVKTLLAAEIKEHPNIKEADLPQLAKLLQFIKENNFFSQSKELKKTANEVRLRAIDCLIEKVKSTSDNSSLPSSNNKYLDLLVLNLNTFVQMNKDDKSKELKPVLGRVYYLLADIRLYFHDDESRALPLFRQAHEMVPTNLYYKLKYYQLDQNDDRFEVIQQISEIADLHYEYYLEWVKARWKEKNEFNLSENINIHATPEEKAGLFSRLRGIF